MKFQKAERVGTAVSVALISPGAAPDVQAVAEEVRKASPRAYRGLLSHKVTSSRSATSSFLFLLLCTSCFLHMNPVRSGVGGGGGGGGGFTLSEQKETDSAVYAPIDAPPG